VIRTREISVHALGLAAVAAALLAGAVFMPLDLIFCPFRAATGLPCLTCGCSHAFHFAVRGDLLAALRASPLGVALFLVCAAHLFWTLLRLAGLPFAPCLPSPTPALRLAAGCALALNWAFVALS
jgi:Protein of unknown function (DUF2752)